MAKGQKRSNREVRKPKKEKKTAVAQNTFGKREKGTDGTASWAKKAT